MARTYHVARNGQIIGRYASEDIGAQWGTAIQRGDHYLEEGAAEWRPIEELGERLGLPPLSQPTPQAQDAPGTGVRAPGPRAWLKPALAGGVAIALVAAVACFVPEQIRLHKERVAEEAARVEAARLEKERLARLEAERQRQEEIRRQEAERVAAEPEARRVAEEAEARRVAAERAAGRARLLQDGVDNLQLAMACAKSDVEIRNAKMWRLDAEESLRAIHLNHEDELMVICADYYLGARTAVARSHGRNAAPAEMLDVDAPGFSKKLELAHQRIRATEANPDSVKMLDSHIERIALGSDLHFHAWGSMDSKNRYGVVIRRNWSVIIDDSRYLDEKTGVVHIPSPDSVGGETVAAKAWNAIASRGGDSDGLGR